MLFESAQTLRADFDLQPGTADFDRLFLQVRLPDFSRSFLRERFVDSELAAFAANVAYVCHDPSILQIYGWIVNKTSRAPDLGPETRFEED